MVIIIIDMGSRRVLAECCWLQCCCSATCRCALLCFAALCSAQVLCCSAALLLCWRVLTLLRALTRPGRLTSIGCCLSETRGCDTPAPNAASRNRRCMNAVAPVVSWRLFAQGSRAALRRLFGLSTASAKPPPAARPVPQSIGTLCAHVCHGHTAHRRFGL